MVEGVLEVIKDNVIDDVVFGLDVGNNMEWVIW